MYLPLIHRGDRLHALVLGGGAVAKRKVYDLLEAHAELHVISPYWDSELEALLDDKAIPHETRGYQSGDIEGHNLVIVATDDESVNRAAFEEARRLGVPVNVVDQPELCTVYFAAVVRSDPLLLAISTGGAAPFFARELKHAAVEWLEGGWTLRAKWAELIRRFALDNLDGMDARERLFQRFMRMEVEHLETWDFDHPPAQLWESWSREEEE